jgi:hypothetical protein
MGGFVTQDHVNDAFLVLSLQTETTEENQHLRQIALLQINNQ